ncbi:MAG: hypothetical protein HY033_03825 [Ignavibacteriae bacterium]|nr:hypothetical protein [Ignavibacteria bacterium]MBI3364020.1 hypothetical protein [Ignavibacteriota bacterium]
MDIDEAKEELAQALALNDRLESVYLNLNIIYAYRNDPKSMLNNLERYRRILPPDSRQAILVDQQIEKLRSEL